MDAPRPRLTDDERILWEGQPPSGLRLSPSDALLVPFSLWGGFAIFWNVSVWTMQDSWFFRLWGAPFLIVGVYMIAGRFVTDAFVRKHQRYYVTDRRILIDRSGLGGGLHSLDIHRLPALTLIERRNGSGDLRFGESASPFSMSGRGGGWGIWHPSLQGVSQFVGIPNAAAVYDLVERTARC